MSYQLRVWSSKQKPSLTTQWLQWHIEIRTTYWHQNKTLCRVQKCRYFQSSTWLRWDRQIQSGFRTNSWSRGILFWSITVAVVFETESDVQKFDDRTLKQNLKRGNFTQAQRNCSSILTPNVCNDELLAEQLVENARQYSNQGYNEVSRFWTGSRRVDKRNFIDENGKITSSPFCDESSTYGNVSRFVLVKKNLNFCARNVKQIFFLLPKSSQTHFT